MTRDELLAELEAERLTPSISAIEELTVLRAAIKRRGIDESKLVSEYKAWEKRQLHKAVQWGH